MTSNVLDGSKMMGTAVAQVYLFYPSHTFYSLQGHRRLTHDRPHARGGVENVGDRIRESPNTKSKFVFEIASPPTARLVDSHGEVSAVCGNVIQAAHTCIMVLT